MKLEVGMYVRTKQGIIDKIMHIAGLNSYGTYYRLVNQTKISFENGLVYKSDILKASHNIIDLIEVGDYVNGYRVDEIGEYHSIKTDKVETYAKVNCSALLNCFYEEDIKSIVTKEMFSSVEYRVGSEE